MLLLDEPSSMMDPATEARLIDNLRSIKGVTMLLVTHRMAMLPLVDRLVVLDQGRVVMDGPRNEVLRKLQGGPGASSVSAAPGRPQHEAPDETHPARLQAEAISSHPDFDRGPRKAVLILLATTALFFVLLFAWMSFAALDISVNAQGAVIPSSRVQQIQSMEGGILQALQAREGMQVKKGDVLATVQNLQFNAEQGEAQQGLWGAQAALVRLDAEARNATPAFPPSSRRTPRPRPRAAHPVADPPPGAREQPRDPRPPARPAPAGTGRGARPPPGHRRSDRPGPRGPRHRGEAGRRQRRRPRRPARRPAALHQPEGRTRDHPHRHRAHPGRGGRGPGPAVGDPRPLPRRDQQGAHEAELRAAQLAEQLTGRNDKVARRELRARWTASSTGC
jgi:hypothetical protein